MVTITDLFCSVSFSGTKTRSKIRKFASSSLTFAIHGFLREWKGAICRNKKLNSKIETRRNYCFRGCNSSAHHTHQPYAHTSDTTQNGIKFTTGKNRGPTALNAIRSSTERLNAIRSTTYIYRNRGSNAIFAIVQHIPNEACSETCLLRAPP